MGEIPQKERDGPSVGPILDQGVNCPRSRGFSPVDEHFLLYLNEEDIVIPLKALSGGEFYLNNDLIVKIEALPDTVITLNDGRTLRVKDTPEEIIEKIIQYKRRIYQGNLEVK